MNDEILSIIEYKSPSFSKGQKRLAAVITESYDKTAFMTASKLGTFAGVSESTVVRFAMELGYEGYPQMQKAMQEMVLGRLTSVQRMGVSSNRLGDQDLVSTVLHADAEKLRQTCDTVDRRAFKAAVDAISRAKNIYVLGVRSAAHLAGFFGDYLKYMFDSVHIVTAPGTGEVLEKLINVGPGDVVVAFSFPRYSTSTVRGAAYCHSTGAAVIGLTNTMVSPLAQYCDHVLIAKSDMVSLVDSLAAPLSLSSALIVALANSRQEPMKKTLEKLERVWEDQHIYEKQVDNL